MKKIIENFVGTSDKAEVDGLGYPYSLNIMTEDTGEGKAVERVLKTVNGQTEYDVSQFMVGLHKDEPIGMIKDAFVHGGWIWLITANGIFRCKQTDDPTNADYWDDFIIDKTDFTNFSYRHVIVDSVCFIMDFAANKMFGFSLDENSSIDEILMPKRKYWTTTGGEWREITVTDICASYGYVMLADKTSNRIYYSMHDFKDLLSNEYGTLDLTHLFDGYYDYDEKTVKVRDNNEGQWFEQTAYDGNMRMILSLDGTLYGVSTGCTQRYSYNSSTSEPFTPDLNGVTHLKLEADNGFLHHAELESSSMVYAMDDNGNGGLHLFAKDGIKKISSRSLDIQFAKGNTPTWLRTMLYSPNHRLFAACMIDDEQYRWAVWDASTNDWHWRSYFPWIQLGGDNAVFSQGSDWLSKSDKLAKLTEWPTGFTIIRQGGAIYNGGDNFIADRCEMQTSKVWAYLQGYIQWAWDDDSFNTEEQIPMLNDFAKCAIGMGMGRLLTIRFSLKEYLMDSPLIIRALKLSYRPANNFLRWC